MPTANTLDRITAAIPNLLLRLILANAFLAGAFALHRPEWGTRSAEPTWLPPTPGLASAWEVVLAALSLALLLGAATRAAALASGLAIVLLLALHLHADPFFNTATHLLPWLACTVGLLLLPTRGTLSVDGLRDRLGSADEGPWPSAATLLSRLFLGAIATFQGLHVMTTSGPLRFALKQYVEPFAGRPLPEPMLWVAGVLNPVLLIVCGPLLLLGLCTRAAAGGVGLFLVTILFGHVLRDPLDRGGDMHDYAFANMLVALAVLLLAPRGDRFALDGALRRRRFLPLAALVGLTSCAMAQHPPVTSEATDCLPAARALLAEARRQSVQPGLESAWAALDAFARAAEIDPRCEPALAEAAALLASGPIVYSGPGRHLSARDGYTRASALATAALALDPTDPLAHFALGVRAFYLDYDWCRALAELGAAAAAPPRFPRASVARAYLLAALDREDAALAELRDLAADPASEGAAGLAEGIIHYMDHRQVEAVAVLQKVAARFPSLFVARFYLGMALVQLGRAEEGVVELEAAAAASGRNPGALSSLAQAHAAAGQPEKAHAVLDELARRAPTEVIPIYQTAGIHLALGDRGRALDQLEEAVHVQRDNWPTWLEHDPRWEPLRAEPRFRALVRELDFEGGKACARQANASPG